MQPVLNKFEVIPHAAAIEPHPVKSFNPLAVESVLFERRAAEIEAF